MNPPKVRKHGDSAARSAGRAVRFITSVRLAVGLIAYLVITSVASTLVPGWGTRFFASPAFLVPAAAFFVNLAACSIRRFVRELRRPHRRRHGPDLLHLGLVLLMIGSVVSYQGKRTGSVSLAAGDSATLPDGSTLTVTDFHFDRYPDGRPRDWVTTLRITSAGRTVIDGFALRVNRPRRRAGTSYYQSSYGEEWRLVLHTDAGPDVVLHEGERAQLGGTVVRFLRHDTGGGSATARALIGVGEGEAATVVRARSGDRLGAVSVRDVRSVLTSGIEAVRDPGWPVVAAALALVALGTAVTFLQKLREAA